MTKRAFAVFALTKTNSRVLAQNFFSLGNANQDMNSQSRFAFLRLFFKAVSPLYIKYTSNLFYLIGGAEMRYTVPYLLKARSAFFVCYVI